MRFQIKRHWKRILLAIILVPLLLLGGILIYIQSNHSEIIKSEIEKLNKEHEGLVRFLDSELSLFKNFPYISIRIDDVQIFETKEIQSQLIMDVKDVYIGFNLWDIINGNYEIKSLVVEEGVFNIAIHENNTTNIQNALATPSETDSTSTNIHLKKIKFKNLDIHTIDEATNTDVEKFIYSGTGGFSQNNDLTSGHIDTEFELNVIKDGDTTFINKKHFEAHTDLSFNSICVQFFLIQM